MLAQHPARQLNSKTLKDAATGYVIPEVQGKYCIVSASCVWRVDGCGENLIRAWELICHKRSQLDTAIENLPGVAFFFSSITSSESVPDKKGKGAITDRNNKDVGADEESTIVSSQRSMVSELSTSSSINTAVEKDRLPSFAYWIAFESPNGAPVSLVRMQRSLLDCDVEIDTKILSSRPGTSAACDMTKRLCNVLKDHNSSYIGDIVNASFQKCFDDATQHLDMSDDLEDARSELGEHALRFVLLNGHIVERMKTVIEALIRAGLQLDVRGLDVSSRDVLTKSGVKKAITSDACTQLINDIEVLMKNLGYAIHQGNILKKNAKAVYTFSYKCDVNTFIGTLEGNDCFRTRLIKYGDKVREKLKNPKSQLIRQLEVNYDLIEICDGWCLSMSKREFLKVIIIFCVNSVLFSLKRFSLPRITVLWKKID